MKKFIICFLLIFCIAAEANAAGRIRHRERKYNSGLPTVSQTFDFTSALPSGFTYSRADTVATYRDASGELALGASNTPRFDHTSSGTALGILIEDSRVNRCTNNNAVISATTNMTTTGDATLTTTADATALGNAKLANVVTSSVFEASGGAGGGTIVITCDTGATGSFSASLYARVTAGTSASFGITPAATATTISGAAYQRFKADNLTATATTDDLVITIPASTTIRFALNQVEAGKFSTSVIKVAGATATRQRDLLQDTSIASRDYYSAEHGAIVVDTDVSEIVNHGNSHFFILAEGTGLTNAMSVYMVTGRSKTQTRTYVDSSLQYSADIGSVDKAGEGDLYRVPVGATWRNGSEVTLLTNSGIYHSIAPAGTIDGIDRLVLGGRSFTEALNGHIRSVKMYDQYRTVEQMGLDMVLTGERGMIFAGQSNSTGPFSAESGSANGGEKAGITIVDSIWTSTRNWLVNGGTAGTSVLFYSGTSASDDWWYDADTGALGVPFQRWINIARGNANNDIRAIVDISGESDAGNSTVQEFKDAQLAKFAIMRGYVGNVPVVLVPLGRNTSGDLAGYETIRQAQRELAEENPSFIYLAPERFDLALTDTIHLTDAANQTMMQRVMRKTLSALGETITGPVDGSEISDVSRSGTTVTVTLTHPSGITDFTPTTGIEGFVFTDNGTPITIDSAVRTDATTITLTLNSTPSGAEMLYYGQNSLSAVTTSNLVHGNDANALPLRSGQFPVSAASRNAYFTDDAHSNRYFTDDAHADPYFTQD